MSANKTVFYRSVLLLIVCASGIIINVDGKLEELYRWKQMSYDILDLDLYTDGIAFPDEKTTNELRQEKLSAQSANFVAYNNVPMGVTHHRGKLFITMPRRRPGIPATLNYVHTNLAKGLSPKLSAYPSYKVNELHPQLEPDSNRIISVYRTRLDACNRLWFIDTGLLEYPNNAQQVQRPAIWVIDLNTNERVMRFEIPESIVARGNGVASITVDVNEYNCDDAFAYIPDLANYHLYVYSLRQNKIWSFSHNYFHFDPLHGDFNIRGLRFSWDDGIFSITLGNQNHDGYRTAYFHPMVSVSEFSVSTKVLKNETASQRSYQGDDFVYLGSRGNRGQSAMHDYDPKTGVIFFSRVAANGIGCWNTNKPFSENNYAVLANDDEKMIYPSDLSVDQEGTVWMMTNSMPIFIYSQLNPNIYNFRVWRLSAREMIQGTVCSGPRDHRGHSNY